MATLTNIMEFHGIDFLPFPWPNPDVGPSGTQHGDVDSDQNEEDEYASDDDDGNGGIDEDGLI